MKRPDAKVLAGAVGACVMLGLTTAVVMQDRHERALVASGQCEKLREELFAPAPVAHSSCHGDPSFQSCTTYFTQADPYLRSLWRCKDPEARSGVAEFWRRTAEEHGR